MDSCTVTPGGPVPDVLTADLGKSFEIMRTAVKPHACCRYMQGPIDAILEIMRERNPDAQRIANIEVAILEAGWDIVCEPGDKKYHPESAVDAQFSMPFRRGGRGTLRKRPDWISHSRSGSRPAGAQDDGQSDHGERLPA